MPKQVYFWIALVWTGIIFLFCLLPSGDIPKISIPNLDKVVHALFHFVFTLTWFLFFKKQLNSASVIKPLAISFVLSVFFGIGIEILQKVFTTTRNGDAIDVLANMSGATLAVCFILIVSKYNSLDKI
ncbi:VanZ family protein [Flavobacterium sp. CG_23.5]|uniref:VanZ family protein n=1 Tax=unclassified Flavobacterium TaxID=196869 RepID=UPI0018C9F039|nr:MULTISPECIES: VanZ family protein [unclassified Flavobacterium]MBG6110495.1 VanZ family protein [Flavobacterium sp. CG_9.10]MBP2284075.1 VanZ family protein [Flavobacterium sp. CG_23.5]